jgi:hypothetical protein
VEHGLNCTVDALHYLDVACAWKEACGNAAWYDAELKDGVSANVVLIDYEGLLESDTLK